MQDLTSHTQLCALVASELSIRYLSNFACTSKLAKAISYAEQHSRFGFTRSKHRKINTRRCTKEELKCL